MEWIIEFQQGFGPPVYGFLQQNWMVLTIVGGLLFFWWFLGDSSRNGGLSIGVWFGGDSDDGDSGDGGDGGGDGGGGGGD